MFSVLLHNVGIFPIMNMTLRTNDYREKIV